MEQKPTSLDQDRREKEPDPIIGQMAAGDLAAILSLGFQCWLEDKAELHSLPEDVRKPLVWALRSGFFYGIGKMAELVETHRRFGGQASWVNVCDELDALLPPAQELSARLGEES